MRFLVDSQLPPALARWLTAAGHPSEHVVDVAMAAASDQSVWAHAVRTGAVIITKDQDFAVLRIMSDAPTPGVVWLRIGNSRRVELLRWFEPLLPAILTTLGDGTRLVEVE
jgi:predicted nuclease of predicted toxin-antitoxin system